VGGAEVHEIPLLEVQKQDVIIVAKGAMITVDGLISDGESSIDEAFVTGEPFPERTVKSTGAETPTAPSLSVACAVML
jgi:cation transport ATPase